MLSNGTKKLKMLFRKLKAAMVLVPVLALPDFHSRLFWRLMLRGRGLEADASGTGLGAVLMQKQRPIAYFSQVLSAKNRLKSVYERELMAMVLAIQKWRHYLLGQHSIFHTDQRNLKYLLEQRVVNANYQKWLSKILGYDFEIRFKPGLENKAADALSRVSNAMKVELAALTIPRILDVAKIDEEVSKDTRLGHIRVEPEKGKTGWPKFSVHQGHLLYQGRLVVPKGSDMIPTPLHDYHDSVVGGHSGFLRTYKRLAADVSWMGMQKDIKRFVEECSVCQRNKYLSLTSAGLLQSLPIPD